MRHRHPFRRLGALTCTAALVLALLPAAGAAAGVILTAFFMIAGDGILPCVGMLMLSRIACLLRPWRISSAESVPKS